MTAVVPRSARPAWVAPVAVGAAAACGCAAIAMANPSDGGVPICWSQAVFGVDCPFCGGLRCVSSLVRGDWAAAADHNVVAAVLVPLAALAWLWWLVAALRERPLRWRRPPTWALVGVGVVLIAFTVARNVGGPAWVDWLASTTHRG